MSLIPLFEIAERQHGLIARRQALAVGVTARQVEHACHGGLLHRVQPGVYRFSGAAGTWRQTALGAVLAAGPGALVSHRAAAALAGYEGARFGVIDLSSPRWARRPRGHGILLHEATDLCPEDRAEIDGIPVTNPMRTVIDSGCLVPLPTLDTWIDQGLREGWFTLDELVARRKEVARRGRNGVGPLGMLLRERSRSAAVTHSGFEVALSRLVVRLGFARPERQVRIFDAGGNFIAQADLGYSTFRTVMEADSESWHLNRRSFHEDRKRWNRMKAAGYEVLVYTWQHVHREPEHVDQTLRGVLHLQARRLGLDYSKLRS